MPRSTSIRKYKSSRERVHYRKHSHYKREYSQSGSRHKQNQRHYRKYNNIHHRYHDKDSYRGRDNHRHYTKYDRSESKIRSKYKKRDDSYEKKNYKKYDKYNDKSYCQYQDKKKLIVSGIKSASNIKPQYKGSSGNEKDRNKDAGHYKYRDGYIINDQYRIIRHLGDGTFGRVLEVEDVKTKKIYAVKAIRAVKRYVESAQIEARILQDIQKKDPEGKNQIVRLETAFLKDPSRPYREQNYFMVFERLGMSLYDFLKMNNYRGFEIGNIQSFARQIISSIGFMHSIGLTHTDLKPENILLVRDEHEPLRYRQHGESDDRSSTCSNSEEKIYYKPINDQIKIIDMGGATYDHEHHTSIINTRQYRAPEVMLSCCPWSYESDVWSIGCILLELYTGDLYFATHETYEHLAMIDKALGPIPYWMGYKADEKIRKNFILDEGYFKAQGTFFDWPKYASGNQSVRRVSNMKLINDIIPPQYPEFRDLLKRMLTIDPNMRIKCSEALNHDFFKVKYESLKE